MSQNTVDTVDNGSNDTDVAAQRTLSDAELLEFLQLRAEAQKAADAKAERDAKAEEARQARKRANGRGIDPLTGKEYAAHIAFLMSEATLLTNWLNAYKDDPARLIQRMTDQFVPAIVALSQVPSTYSAGQYDAQRHAMNAWHAGPPEQAAPQTPKQGDKK